MVCSKKAFRDACITAGAHRVSAAAMDAYEARMERMLVDVAGKTVGRMVADKRVTVEARDVHTFNLVEE